MKTGRAPLSASTFSRWGLLAFALAMAGAGSRPVLAGAVQPTLTKSFLPTTINVGETSVLTFTVSSQAGLPALSNIGFVDSLPSGLVVANPPSVGGTCANAAAATTAAAGTTMVTVSNLQVPAGPASCTVTVNVTNATGQTNSSCAGSPAEFTNTSLNVTVTNVTNAVQPSCVAVLAPSPTSTPTPTDTPTPTSTPTQTNTPTITPSPTVTTAPPSALAVPTLSHPMLALLALGLVGIGLFLRRRS